MKKYLIALVTLALTSNFAFALDGERPDRKSLLERQIDRISSLIESGELTQERADYLNARLEVLNLQKDFRDAVKAAMQELGEEATREERRAAMEGVREDFAEQLDTLKDARRAFFDKRRRLHRDSKEGE